MRIGSFDLQEGEKEGFRLIAPVTYWMASEEEILAHTGGCGPGKWGDWFVPDTIYGESIFLACQIHDWCYFFGLTLKDKLTADQCFLWNQISILNGGFPITVAQSYRAMTYFNAVARCGEKAFLVGKEGFKEGYAPSKVMADLETGVA
jgi:hypothetical protein